MVFCLDTDHIVEYFRGNEKVVHAIKTRIESNEQLFITYITLCELFEGAYLSQKQFLEVERIKLFIQSVRILDFTVKACELFGKISAKLEKDGEKIGDADLLIGCIALTHGCTLVTNNVKHFRRIENLELANWIKED